MSMDFKRKLPIPMEAKALFPISKKAGEKKAANDKEISAVITGKSEKKLLIIGPCSADREDAVFEYCSRLRGLQDKVADKLIIIPRIYSNKPRTTGNGYKGMLHQPDPNEKPDPYKGILATRRLHSRVLTELGLSTADELLYPANYRYLSDLLSYVTIGARSVENQEHRLVSSGITVPVGMKNPTSGDLSVMMNSVSAAHLSHEFIYRGWDVETSGNPLTHAILRGYINSNGESISNYHYDDLIKLNEIYKRSALPYPACIVDTNHANSGKNYLKQPEIVSDVMQSMAKNNEIRQLIKGFMIESYLVDGAQKIGADEIPGCSITDPCLGWEKTEKLIYGIAELV